MNDQLNDNSRSDFDPVTSNTAQMLNQMVEGIQPDATFASKLEQRLMAVHTERGARVIFSARKLAPALMWILVIGLMALVLDWAIRSLAPEPVPAARSSKTPTLSAPVTPVERGTPMPSRQSYDWHGTKLNLAAVLPDSPSEADVYLAQPAQHATIDEAMALAERFGIRGEAYVTSGEVPDTQDYLITDGKQSLRVRSSQYFSYTADIIQAYNNFDAITKPEAESVIGDFLEARGFTFPYRVEWSDFREAYVVEPLAQDGTPLRYEHYAPPMMVVMLDPKGDVLSLQASLLNTDIAQVGRYGILSAQQAFDELLDPARTNGMVQSVNSLPAPIQSWKRTYPSDQTLTLYGNVSSSASAEPGKPAFLQIDGFPVVGQVDGMDSLSQPTYVQATGRFASENGIEKFSVESWKVSDVNEDGLVGTIQKENGQTTLTTDDGAKYVLPDVPADVPMPFEKAFVVGTKIGDTFEWKLIDDRVATGGGGGGGGGSGFYKLNLTGTPVPFPTATASSATAGGGTAGGAQYTVQAGDTLGKIASSYGADISELMRANNMTDPNSLTVGQVLTIPGAQARQVEGLRGMLSITISKQQDGSEMASYGFIANASSDPSGYVLLEGDNLQKLQAYNNRPVDIWGTFEVRADKAIPVVKVDRFEIPFPDLQFQILHGTQKLIDIGGQTATLFTAEDGTSYVQFMSDGTSGNSLIGEAGHQVVIESLAIPGESLGGYPALRVFGGSPAINPKNGQAMQLAITADKPSVLEAPPPGEMNAAPTLTIEKVELVHFLSDPRYAVKLPNAQPPYFQPVWRFYGHYSNGDEFEILIQALRQEYLLPEVEPGLQPG